MYDSLHVGVVYLLSPGPYGVEGVHEEETDIVE
jgi:hypothetical protein